MAGGGRASKYVTGLLPLLDQANQGRYHLRETKKSGDAIKLARTAVEEGCQVIIVMGGDGTINEVINGMMQRRPDSRSDCELGIIDCGSGSDLVRSLDLPQKREDQLKLILHKKSRPIDLGFVQYQGIDGLSRERYFVNECSIGISGSVIEAMTTRLKQRHGPLAFALASIHQLFTYHAAAVQVHFDNQVEEIEKVLGIVIANGKYAGGGMKLAPDANLQDGLLDVLSMADMNLVNRLITFSKIYRGNHIHSKYANYRRATTIGVKSNQPLRVETDGELVGHAPCQVNVLPGVLRLRY